MATTQLDRLRAALPYSSGAARREIAQQIAEAAASAAAEPLPPRWCAWCGETLAAGKIGDYCNETCEAEDAAAPADRR